MSRTERPEHYIKSRRADSIFGEKSKKKNSVRTRGGSGANEPSLAARQVSPEVPGPRALPQWSLDFLRVEFLFVWEQSFLLKTDSGYLKVEFLLKTDSG